MNRWIGICVMALVCVLAAGCSKPKSDQDVIRETIDKRLNERMDLNVGAMDRAVKQVSVDGDHATAQVEFRLKGKGNDSGPGMVIQYVLERQGKEWVVLSSEPMGAGHPGADDMPGGPDGPMGQ